MEKCIGSSRAIASFEKYGNNIDIQKALSGEMKMKRIKSVGNLLLVMMIILFSISISGCFHKYSLETVTMMTQAFYAIPDAENEPHSLQAEFIETDNYGRTLFAFSSGSVSALCILQKSDDKYVYYYNNVSFLIGSYNYKKYNPEDLDALKEANDWDEAIDENKMIKRELNQSDLLRNRDSAIGWRKANSILDNALGADEKNHFSSEYFDYSQTGQEIFCVYQMQNTSTTGEYDWEVLEEYLMILNADGSYDPENYLIQIDDWDQINTLLAEIKDRNGWVG